MNVGDDRDLLIAVLGQRFGKVQHFIEAPWAFAIRGVDSNRQLVIDHTYAGEAQVQAVLDLAVDLQPGCWRIDRRGLLGTA